MQTIYAVVALSSETGRFFTVMTFEGPERAEAHAASLRTIPGVAAEVVETETIPVAYVA